MGCRGSRLSLFYELYARDAALYKTMYNKILQHVSCNSPRGELLQALIVHSLLITEGVLLAFKLALCALIGELLTLKRLKLARVRRGLMYGVWCVMYGA